MKPFSFLSVAAGLALSLLTISSSPIAAQSSDDPTQTPASADGSQAFLQRLKQLGGITEGTGKIGNHAEIDLPSGYIFLPAKGA